MRRYDRDAFVSELHELFPAAADDIDPEIDEGLLHLEMGAFARYTAHTIEQGDRKEAIRCFQFAERLLKQGTPEVQNAVHVSYLEHLMPPDGHAWMFEAMTSFVREAWFGIQGYNDEIHGSSVAETWKKKRRKY